MSVVQSSIPPSAVLNGRGNNSKYLINTAKNSSFTISSGNVSKKKAFGLDLLGKGGITWDVSIYVGYSDSGILERLRLLEFK